MRVIKSAGLRRTLKIILPFLLIPSAVAAGALLIDAGKHAFVSLAVTLLSLLFFMTGFEEKKTGTRRLVLVSVTVALSVTGRFIPFFKPITALTVLTGIYLGGEAGFLVGSMSAVVSNFYFGQGPWTPFQMFAMGIIGFLAGVLFRRGWLRRSRAALCVFGAIAAVVIYGGIMNPVSALLYARTLEWKVIAAYYVTGFPVDCVHAAATVFFLWVLAEPMLEKLDRIKVKYGLVE